jgi:hypothetical protein
VRAAAPAPAPVRTAAPAPAPARAISPALVIDDEDDDALIPMPEDDLLADGEDLGSGDLLEEDAPEEITQSLGRPPAPAPAPRAAEPEIAGRSDEIELTEADLAALDTSDLEPVEEDESLFDTSGADLTEGDPEPRD